MLLGDKYDMSAHLGNHTECHVIVFSKYGYVGLVFNFPEVFNLFRTASRFNVSGVVEVRGYSDLILVPSFFFLQCPSNVPTKQNGPRGLVYFLCRDEVVVHDQNKGLRLFPGWK